jgi:hypothetical protein
MPKPDRFDIRHSAVCFAIRHSTFAIDHSRLNGRHVNAK